MICLFFTRRPDTQIVIPPELDLVSQGREARPPTLAMPQSRGPISFMERAVFNPNTSPVLERRSCPGGASSLGSSSEVILKPTSGLISASLVATSRHLAFSVWGPFRNFFLAGTLAKRSDTVMEVPSGQPASSMERTFPAWIAIRVPEGDPLSLVTISTLETAAMEARASPLKPRV